MITRTIILLSFIATYAQCAEQPTHTIIALKQQSFILFNLSGHLVDACIRERGITHIRTQGSQSENHLIQPYKRGNGEWTVIYNNKSFSFNQDTETTSYVPHPTSTIIYKPTEVVLRVRIAQEGDYSEFTNERLSEVSYYDPFKHTQLIVISEQSEFGSRLKIKKVYEMPGVSFAEKQ